MKVTSEKLIYDLISSTNKNIKAVTRLKTENISVLNAKRAPEKWSALECIQHLNLYGVFYIPEITMAIKKAKKNNSKDFFKSGLIGNYFAKSMLPKEKLNKMKTFKDMNPNGSALSTEVLDTFLNQQKQILDLLNQAKEVNLSAVKIKISISKIIKLKLGDTFRFVINHNQRHILQAQKAIEVLERVS